MPVDPATRAYVNRRISAAISNLRADLTEVFKSTLPRHDEFTLTDIATGATEQAVSWLVPIPGDYAIHVAPTTGAAVAGFVSGNVKAGTKTPTGCTVIVANRSGGTIATAAFDVLAFPIGG